MGSIFGLGLTVLFYSSYLPLSSNFQVFPLNYFLSPALPGIYLTEFLYAAFFSQVHPQESRTFFVLASGTSNYFFWGLYGAFLALLRKRQYEFGLKSAAFSVVTFFVSVASMTYALQVGMDLDDPSMVHLIFFCGLLLGMLSLGTIYAALVPQN